MRWGMAGLLLAALGFGGGTALLVVNRLSEQQVAVLAGTVCGALLALPLGAAIGAYAWSQRSAARLAAQPDRPTPPPVIYMTTVPAPPAPIEAVGPAQPDRLADKPQAVRRAFSVIGGEDLDEA